MKIIFRPRLIAISWRLQIILPCFRFIVYFALCWFCLSFTWTWILWQFFVLWTCPLACQCTRVCFRSLFFVMFLPLSVCRSSCPIKVTFLLGRHLWVWLLLILFTDFFLTSKMHLPNSMVFFSYSYAHVHKRTPPFRGSLLSRIFSLVSLPLFSSTCSAYVCVCVVGHQCPCFFLLHLVRIVVVFRILNEWPLVSVFLFAVASFFQMATNQKSWLDQWDVWKSLWSRQVSGAGFYFSLFDLAVIDFNCCLASKSIFTLFHVDSLTFALIWLLRSCTM